MMNLDVMRMSTTFVCYLAILALGGLSRFGMEGKQMEMGA